ncbi:hypothetical protein CSUI_002919 [Cystoisospora suis]|uniref:Uncharacterized protein n=1 Tax=Cystoisospora suis TaxID=483139 RepID=A0A2C6KGP9_9APIC|nr:hypothetical protein CSUI_002919 [Cystoisospora suis]
MSLGSLPTSDRIPPLSLSLSSSSAGAATPPPALRSASIPASSAVVSSSPWLLYPSAPSYLLSSFVSGSFSYRFPHGGRAGTRAAQSVAEVAVTCRVNVCGGYGT